MVGAPKVLIGASIPRSGHHFLQGMLSRLFGPRLHYCEYYSPKDCCRHLPCTRRGDFAFVFQKSHDREMEVPKTVAEAVYVIQYRHPVPEALSDRELDTADGFGRQSLNWRLSREHYAHWLAAKAVYYRRFHDKWLAERVPNGVYLDYDELSAAPAEALEAILSAAGADVDRARIEAVVEQARGVRVSTAQRGTPAPAFRPRVVEDSPHFDADLLGAFEDYVLRHCPHFGYARMLEERRYEGHPLHGLILAADPAEPLPEGQTDRLEAAIALAGEHPELMIRLAEREMAAGDAAAAAARLGRVVQAHPWCPHAYRPLLAALFGGESLLGLSGRPELIVEVARILLDAGQVVNAVAALGMALALSPGLAEAHRLMGAALLKAGQPRQALRHAEAAMLADPASAATSRLLGAVHRRLAAPRAA